ncbi:MAG: DEAD/DEAH box helicase [Thermoplasmata archaeon]|nr:DEAD/DEAH box helicase [Thermoplasmata archaeon]MCI4353800.1 DEAD/DEAH box helicase [Thermoplasmata archaeon]
METVSHPRIRPGILEDRLYQSTIADKAVDRNTLVVLPTGLGKTAIALRVIAEHLHRFPTRSVLFLAPTRPLVVQHARSVATTLFGPDPVVLTGTVSPEKRAALLHPPQVVVATPQVIGNDVARGELTLAPYSLIVFDEAHRAVGDYPYVFLGRANQEGPKARVLAMTASPGARKAKIEEVWANLGIEHFEYRTAFDEDVRPYLHGVGVEVVTVQVPADVRYLAVLLRAAVQRQGDLLRHHNLLPTGEVGRRDLLALRERLQRELASARRRGTEPPAGVWGAVTAQAAAMKGLHALELIESQGVEALRDFLLKQEKEGKARRTPSQRAFLDDPDVVRAREALAQLHIEHPKIAKTVEIVASELRRSPQSRALVFAQYRDTARVLVEQLEALHDPAVRTARFVGQASHDADEGLSQKEQIALLDRFRSGSLNCLVATSVAEEGLDIPSTDLVVFYEPVPSMIRTIQRRGRTGRARAGRVVMLVAEGTRDVGLERSARSKERRMHDVLEEIEEEARRGTLPPPPPPTVQRSIDEFD